MPEPADELTDEPADSADEGPSTDLPVDVAEEAARLTRLALEATDRVPIDGPFQDALADTSADAPPEEAALYRERRDALLDRFDYVARVREDREGGATLVCYPAEWLDDEGTVRLDAGLDTARAVEVSLSGPGEQGDFEAAAEANDDLVAAVAEELGDVHAANVRSFADFMNNHYARPVTTASAAEVEEFLEHYYPRNAWPTEEQAAVVEQSLRSAFDLWEEPYPLD